MSVNKTAAANAVNSLESSMGFPKDSLLNVMLFETMGTLSPSIQSPVTLATGLIQFMPSTARALGTTVDKLKAMTFDHQLTYVKKYFDINGYTSKVRKSADALDLYLAVFFPAAMGKPDSYIIQTSRLSASTLAKQNPVFDLDKNKQITKAEIRKKFKSLVDSYRKKVGLPPSPINILGVSLPPSLPLIVAAVGLVLLLK